MSDFDAGTTAQEEAASPASPDVDEPTEQSAPASSPEQDLVAKLRLTGTENELVTIRGWIAHHFG